MSFARWLNALTGVDWGIILVIFLIACWLAYLTIKGLRNWYRNLHQQSRYVPEIRITPFNLAGIATIYTIILYSTIGIHLINWIKSMTE
ncbi:MAG: hypothetical protein ACE5D2_04140 [Fidelibacterota bacterium]